MDWIKKCDKVIVGEIANDSETRLICNINNIPLAAYKHTVYHIIFDNMNFLHVDNYDSIAIDVDESDIRVIAQCSIFVRFIDSNFKVIEDILLLYPVQTRGQDIFNYERLHKFHIPIIKISIFSYN